MRITFEIPDEQHRVLSAVLPYGMRKRAYQWLIESYVEYLKRDPGRALDDLTHHHLDIARMQEATLGGSVERAPESA
jgi:hypothetical protein